MRILIALGGNALISEKAERTYEAQYKVANEAMAKLYDVLQNNEVVLTHGNGPQVGDILLRNEQPVDGIPSMPLHACGSMSQGLISEILIDAYGSLSRNGKQMISVFSRALVSSDDKAFHSPSKPIGRFYPKEEADYLAKKYGWSLKNTSNGTWRRVVPSPMPQKIMEEEAVKKLLDSGFIPISAGGGGTPVVKNGNRIEGVEAVIDKDLASSVLAHGIGCSNLVILTDVEGAYRNYGTHDSERIGKIKVSEVEELYRKGEFGSGSMGPKILASTEFIRGGGKLAVISSLNNAGKAVSGGSGTVIIPG